MNDEAAKKSKLTLDQRFASRPHTNAQLHAIADMMDQALANGATADQAEAMALREIRKLAQGMLTDWAEVKQEQSVRAAERKNPQTVRHSKKK
jgi:hypothetical protein